MAKPNEKQDQDKETEQKKTTACFFRDKFA